MDLLTRLLVISTLGCCVPPSAVGAWGARGAGHEGAGEPLVYAAVPLHAPVPVLHVLSPAPPRPRPRRPTAAAGADLELDETGPRYRPATTVGAGKHRDRLRPASSYRPIDTDYEESYEYTRLAPRPPYEEEYGVGYASAPAPATHHHLYDRDASPTYVTSSAETGPLLYARPSPSGGYTYRRAAPPPPPAPPAPPLRATKEPPYILKIHKYRIVKDRRRRRR